jgi:hypothetical protein
MELKTTPAKELIDAQAQGTTPGGPSTGNFRYRSLLGPVHMRETSPLRLRRVYTTMHT